MTQNLRRSLIALLAGGACIAIGSAASAETAATDTPAASSDPAVAAPTAVEDQIVPAAVAAAPSLVAGEKSTLAAAAESAAVPTEATVAAPAATSSGWVFSAYPYVWTPAVNGTFRVSAPAPSTASASANFHVAFTDILDNLKFGILGAAELRHDRISFFTDALYLYAGFPGSTVHQVSGPLGHTVAITASGTVDMKAFVFTNGAGYDLVHSDKLTVSLFGGFRYLGADLKLSWGVNGPLGGVLGYGQAGRYIDYMDGVAGVRGDVRLGDSRWKFDYYGDVGGGGNFTYQLIGQFAYSMKWGQVALGWRYLNFQQPSSSPAPNISMSGPILSAVYRFGS